MSSQTRYAGLILAGSWSNASNAEGDTPSTSASYTGSGSTPFLVATNFGFSLPSGASLDGIEVEIRRSKSGAADVDDGSVRIRTVDEDYGNDYETDDAWPETAANAVYGGESDLWGLSQNLAAVDGNRLSVRLQAFADAVATSRVYSIKVTIHYNSIQPSLPYTVAMLPAKVTVGSDTEDSPQAESVTPADSLFAVTRNVDVEPLALATSTTAIADQAYWLASAPIAVSAGGELGDIESGPRLQQSSLASVASQADPKATADKAYRATPLAMSAVIVPSVNEAQAAVVGQQVLVTSILPAAGSRGSDIINTPIATGVTMTLSTLDHGCIVGPDPVPIAAGISNLVRPGAVFGPPPVGSAVDSLATAVALSSIAKQAAVASSLASYMNAAGSAGVEANPVATEIAASSATVRPGVDVEPHPLASSQSVEPAAVTLSASIEANPSAVTVSTTSNENAGQLVDAGAVVSVSAINNRPQSTAVVSTSPGSVVVSGGGTISSWLAYLSTPLATSVGQLARCAAGSNLDAGPAALEHGVSQNVAETAACVGYQGAAVAMSFPTAHGNVYTSYIPSPAPIAVNVQTQPIVGRTITHPPQAVTANLTEAVASAAAELLADPAPSSVAPVAGTITVDAQARVKPIGVYLAGRAPVLSSGSVYAAGVVPAVVEATPGAIGAVHIAEPEIWSKLPPSVIFASVNGRVWAKLDRAAAWYVVPG